jgi:hypothetical protein
VKKKQRDKMIKIRSLVAICLVAIFLGNVVQPLLTLSIEGNKNSKKAEDLAKR